MFEMDSQFVVVDMPLPACGTVTLPGIIIFSLLRFHASDRLITVAWTVTNLAVFIRVEYH